MDVMIGFLLVIGLGVLILLSVIVAHLGSLVKKPTPEIPESRVISQSVLVKTDGDITTVQPATLTATICTHRWEIISEKTLVVPHEQRHVIILKCDLCGSLDKTSVVTNKPPAPEWKKENCRHDWDDEKAIRLESAFEQLADAGKSLDMKKMDIEDLPKDFFRKSYTKVRICKVCGEVNTVQASNYEIKDNVVE